MILNTVNHPLTEQQIKELSDSFGKIEHLKEVNHPLFKKLENSPREKSELVSIAFELLRFMLENKYNTIHLPVGSPAQQFIIGKVFAKAKFSIVFSYSERESYDSPKPDGSVEKKSRFVYRGFDVI